MEKTTPEGMVIMNIKEWITSIFPTMSVPGTSSKRNAIINLVSIGELARSGLDQIVDPDTFGTSTRIQIGSVMLGAYGEVIMAEYGIDKSELLSDEDILQMVKALVGTPVVEKADEDA